MAEKPARPMPPDQAQREIALDPLRSVLVQAPAGSGKTDLLTRRFLRLLAEVEEPGQIVAITFTIAAAAEMRNRILSKLEDAAQQAEEVETDPLSMEALARRALAHSRLLGWNLLDQPAQLRISTIDSFCREIALQKPLLSGLGGGLEIAEAPRDLYRRAARRTLQQIGGKNAALKSAISKLLLWRDNNWRGLEELLARMLEQRDRWMQAFVFDPYKDEADLRELLQRPFLRGSATAYTESEWEIVRACFELLRRAVGELKVIFAETGAADFTEVAQIAQSALCGPDGFPSDAARGLVDGIRHLLVDEFQDTSRRQHELLSRLIAAWPEREGRTCFVVGDPMQSIYFFRDADAELFPQVLSCGLNIPNDQPLMLETVRLTANFRTAPGLVRELNQRFRRIFTADDGSGIEFTQAEAARSTSAQETPTSRRHPDPLFQKPSATKDEQAIKEEKLRIAEERAKAQKSQADEIVALIRSHLARIPVPLPKGEKYRIAVLARTHKSLAEIARALREDGIPFLAVDLEALSERPEVLDSLALARALLNPEDRVAWMGLLRAPWCGLTLADLHTLVSADNKDLLQRPVPELLAERSELLSEEGRHAMLRVLAVLSTVPDLRFSQPSVSLGTWLQQVWLRLGGDACVDATARANVDLLWACLDGLPQGEQDFLGPALDAALKDLKALPDPRAESDYGVQLMTIHRAKGLEFEVVIVPDLQAGAGGFEPRLLSWMERGLREPDPSGDITEFLVAPIQPKGSGSGSAKKWVDGQRQAKERQEARRLLYVAATRAREELHLFARPEYKRANDGTLELAEPRESLLKTAWLALGPDIQKRFEGWCAEHANHPGEGTIETLAAGESNLITMPSPPKPALLRRLPSDFEISWNRSGVPTTQAGVHGSGSLYERHGGGLLSRALGTAVHALLEELAQEGDLRAQATLRLQPRIAAEVRAMGVDPAQASRIAAQAAEIARRAAQDPIGRWILSPHPEAASEQRWAGVVAGALRTVQVDRVFRGGAAPMADGDSVWWLIDYKTAHEDGPDRATALPKLRALFAPQLEAYAAVLRNLHGANAMVRAGLYYPRMLEFDWWEI